MRYNSLVYITVLLFWPFRDFARNTPLVLKVMRHRKIHHPQDISGGVGRKTKKLKYPLATQTKL